MSASPRTPDNDESLLFGFKPEEFDFSSYVNFDDVVVPSATSFLPQQSFPHSSAFSAFRDADTSLFNTPYSVNDDDVVPSETPALVADDDVLPSPLWGQLSLFPSTEIAQPVPANTSTVSPVDLSLPLDLVSALAAASESSKARNSNNKRPLSPPLVPAPASEKETSPAPPSKKRRQGSAIVQQNFTGTRHTVIPLLDESAPIQSRNYVGPASKTSRRKVPAAAAKKVAALQAHAESAAVDVSAQIEMTIEDKRKQNTIAARRSRQRKAEHLAELEETIAKLQEEVQRGRLEKELWERRAYAAGWSETAAGGSETLF